MKIKLILFYLIVAFTNCEAQDRALFKKEVFIHDTDTMPYRILLPLNYDPSKKYPLVLFLHGSGERGNDNESQLIHGATFFLNDSIRKNFPAIILFPQCPQHIYWGNEIREFDAAGRTLHTFLAAGEPTNAMVLLQQLLKQVLKQYPADKKRIYIGGLSMGAMGTFEMVRRNPQLFAAAFPICGGADPSIAPKLKNVHWWIFHGAKDDAVPPEFSQQMVNALQKENAAVKFTLYPNANHNSWDSAFAEPALLSWLFAQHQ